MHVLILIPFTALCYLHYLVVGRHRGILNADGLFVLSNWVMTSGTLFLLDDPANRAPGYASITVAPACIYIVVSMLVYTYKPTPRRSHLKISGEVHAVDIAGSPPLKALFVLSVSITVAYYVAVGYNVFALGLSSLASNEQHDYATLRLDSYASSRYLFPGYVNQFKNTILPGLSLVWVHYAFSAKRRSAKLTATGLALLGVFAVLGTGQRGAFIVFLLTALVFIRRVAPERFHKNALRVALPGLALTLLATSILGRSSAEVAAADGSSGRLAVVGRELAARFLHDNQWSGLMAFQFVGSRPTQWGQEWGQALMGVLPSNPGSDLARQVFAYIYKSDRGTSPISMWGSVFYNFEWIGLIALPPILAMALGRLSDMHESTQEMNTLELVGSAGVAAVLGTWIAGGPEVLLNSGAVTSGILWGIGKAINDDAGANAARATATNPKPAGRLP